MRKLILLIFISFSSQINAQGLLNNLRACYPFNCDNAVNQTSTGVGYNGILSPGVSCAVNGHAGGANQAYQFSGNNSYISINGTPLLKPLNSICISGWYYVSSPGQLIFCNSSCNSPIRPAYQLQAVSSGTGIIFQISKTDCINPNTFILSSTPKSLNQWYHVVVYIDNSTASLWVDNVSVTVNHNIPLSYNADLVYIGAGYNVNVPTGFFNYFTGKIDHLRFYDRALTPAEINDLYVNSPNCNSSVTPPPPPPPIPGNYCSTNLNGLTADYRVDLNGFSYNYTTPQNTIGKVIIGKNVCSNGQARLIVEDDNIGTGIHGVSATTSNNNIGIKGTGSDQNSQSAFTSYGVVGEALQTNSNPTALSAGVAGFCGVWNSINMPQGENIGIYGNSISSGGRWAGYFDGDVQFNGAVWGSQYWWGSDKRLKTNIKELGSVSERLKTIRSYTYNYDSENFNNRNFPKNEQIGFLAQELETTFPQLVAEDSKGFLAVNYVGFIPVLLQAHQEQQVKLEQQQQQINELKSLVQSLLNSNTGETNKNVSSVELSDKNTIVLDQNVPNPFAESTTINYFIPSEFNKAQIIFSTNDGKLIKVVDITHKGSGSLSVFANDLTNGIYSYSLVVDGKTIDTKKMVKE